MLEVLRQKELYNVVAVVTRYFGGIKLGAGGLTRTYAKAVSEAIKQQAFPHGSHGGLCLYLAH